MTTPHALQQADPVALALALLERHKAVSGTPNYTHGHGPGGLFSFPGLEPDIPNAMIMPDMGLLSYIPSRTSNYTDPLYGIMTGVTPSTGEEPDGVCDDPPTAGLMKLCTRSFVFGRQSRQTPVFDVDRFGKFRDRSDFNDLRLIGGPNTDNPMIPTLPRGNTFANSVRRDIDKVFTEFAVAWGRDFAYLVWTGDPANNTANDGYKEPFGLETLVNTGYQDAYTGVACPAADSYVRDFGGVDVDSETGSPAIVNELTYMWRNLVYNADHMNLAPVQWSFVMRWSLFYELTAVWPCSYLTYRCRLDGGNSSERLNVSASDQVAMRDQMRGGKYLLIDGERVPVIIDQTIPETALAGSSFQSDIYLLPMRYKGGNPGVFLEYFNYDQPGGPLEAARLLAPNDIFYTTNGGRYMFHKKPPTNFCVQMLAKTEWRVILEVPQLAGRLDNVKYTPLVHERDWDPNASFYVDGGSTDFTAFPSYFPPTG